LTRTAALSYNGQFRDEYRNEGTSNESVGAGRVRRRGRSDEGSRIVDGSQAEITAIGQVA